LLATPLRYFARIAELGSFTAAARELRVSQPSLSVAVRKLEEALGAPLLHRSRQGVTLTRAGEVEEPVKRPLPQEIDIDMDIDEFRRVLREVIQDELGVGDVQLGDRWRGGEVILKPGKEGTQEKAVPIDVLFKKIVGIRDKLRVLEQKVNASKGLAEDEKIQLQQYITGCYGSLTTFNVLFKERDDYFVGQSGKD